MGATNSCIAVESINSLKIGHEKLANYFVSFLKFLKRNQKKKMGWTSSLNRTYILQ